MVVYDLVKDHHTITVNDDESVLSVARKMADANVGAVPVLRKGQLIGIFSERDLMRRIVVERRDAATTRVGEVITTHVATVPPGESLETCMVIMKELKIRHLPICEDGKIQGVVSLRDILLHDVEEKKGELQFMRAYMRSS